MLPIKAGLNKAAHVVAAPAAAGMLAWSPTYLKKLKMNNQPAVMVTVLASQHKQGDTSWHSSGKVVAALATYLAMLPVLKREKVSCNNATIKWHD